MPAPSVPKRPQPGWGTSCEGEAMGATESRMSLWPSAVSSEALGQWVKAMASKASPKDSLKMDARAPPLGIPT